MSSKAIVDIIRCVMNGLALPDNVTWEGVCDAYGYAKHNLPEEVTAALFELLGQYLRRLPPEKEKIKNLFDYWQGKDPLFRDSRRLQSKQQPIRLSWSIGRDGRMTICVTSGMSGSPRCP